MSIRTIIADDESLMRSGLRLLLGAADDIEIIAEAAHGAEAIDLARKLSPDLILMDIRMPVMDGITAVRELATLQGGVDAMVPVIMLTAFDTEDFILDALHAGARGFLLKTTNPEALHAALMAAVQGQQLLSPQVLQTLVSAKHHGGSAAGVAGADDGLGGAGVEKKKDREADALSQLSGREREIAELVAQGLSNDEIAQKLFIAVPTVKTHIARILDKLDVGNRVQIAITVLENR